MAKRKQVDPNESTGSEFAEAVGRAVIAFTRVETTAANLFSALLKSANPLGAAAVLWRVGNFSMRVELMDVAAKWLFGTFQITGELPARWEALRTRMYAASDLRNRLAHSEVYEDMTEDAFKYTLRQPLLDFSRLDPAKLEKTGKAKVARSVDYVTAKGAVGLFEKLSEDLGDLVRDVARAKAPAEEGG